VPEEQVDAPRIRDEVIEREPARGVLLLGLAQDALEVGEVAVDGVVELGVGAVAAAYLVEGARPSAE
jgi:hypothetical protein